MTLDPKGLNRRAAQVLRQRKADVLAKANAERRRREAAREEQIERAKKELVPWIEKLVQAAADDGQYTYTFDFGRGQHPEVVEYLFAYFKVFRPDRVKVATDAWENYDRGVSEKQYTDGMRLHW